MTIQRRPKTKITLSDIETVAPDDESDTLDVYEDKAELATKLRNLRLSKENPERKTAPVKRLNLPRTRRG
jgi:hypothetical protein